MRHKKLYIGESAGFQDCLWGFGMKYAILSGYLAAKSFIDGSDYDVLWKKELEQMIETSLINRYLLEKSGNAGYRYVARKLTEGDPHGFLLKQYNHSSLKHLLLPLARRKYESRVKDENCNHENCTCVWCRCKGKACL
jgi:flavin-dependent dehydrogenase